MALALGFYPFGEEDAQRKDRVIMNLIYSVLKSSHFAPPEVDNEFSEKVYHNFLQNLDNGKRFLTQKDIDALSKYKQDVDNQIRNADLSFFEDALTRYQNGFGRFEEYTRELLSKPFDYEVKENWQTDMEKRGYAKDEEALKERWRKYLKHRVLMRLEEKTEREQNKKERTDTVIEIKGFDTLEKEAREKELEMQEDWFSNLEDMKRIDWVSIYMNSVTGVYDPHTQYFPPQQKEDFEISMTGQLEGIGAQLTQKGEYVTIAKIIVGSACWKQGDLEVGDKILKVAQKGEEPVDVVGMNVRNVVKYIRGPKGTVVRLTVEKVDGTRMIIPIERDVVELEATFAKSTVLGEGEDKVGYIRLPKFYVDFYDDSNRNCAEDVKAELEKLKKEGVNSVVLDLRNNGGGSLRGVIDIVGLFIDEGPVVQVKAPNRDPKVLKDEASGTVYDGPLVVMVNHFSASASEIFAAAIQDYNRGLIIGSKTTFGKGTVQNVLDMDRAVNRNYKDIKPLGALKYTIQKYYRINGGTPQLRGIHPDIVLPDNLAYVKYGEKDQEYALPYNEIESAEYEVWDQHADVYEQAAKTSSKRVKKNEHFQLIDEYAHWLKDQRENTEVSLNFAEYRETQEKIREKSEKYKNMRKIDEELTVTANAADAREQAESKEKKEVAEKWHDKIDNDLYVHEAYRVATSLY